MKDRASGEGQRLARTRPARAEPHDVMMPRLDDRLVRARPPDP